MSAIGFSASIPATAHVLNQAPTYPAAYPYDVVETDTTVLAAGAGAPGNDVNLPQSGTADAWEGRVIYVGNYLGGGAVNVQPFAGDTINGAAAAFALAAQYDGVWLMKVAGVDWFVLAVVP
ncbi:MAG: hypothetical protein JXB32_17985 [Deltaproteobacteria bacterium]|nr:hypothetical protein [Deltaproteobacteria bacterium]